MKKIIQLLFLGLLIASCGDGSEVSIENVIASKDVEAIRKTRAELTTELKALEDKVGALDAAIAELDDNAKLPLVSTMSLQKQRFNHYLELQGDVMTDQNVLVYPEMPGTLYRVYVKEGQRVSKGQILGSIDDGGMSSQLAQMKTQLELSKTTFDRQKRLWEQNIGSEIQYLQAKTQFEAQESAVKQMESQLGKYAIRAPFSGIVDEVMKDQGTVVSPGPGSEAFRIVNLSNMYVEVEVPEAHLPTVVPGKTVEVYFPVLGESTYSKVSSTGNFINPANRSFKVEIPIQNKNGKVKPNLTAVTKINDYTNESAIMVPLSIVSENAEGAQFVYTITKVNENETQATKTIIKPGKVQGDYLEILSGIEEGTEVIVEGARSIRDGQAVKISNEAVAKN